MNPKPQRIPLELDQPPEVQGLPPASQPAAAGEPASVTEPIDIADVKDKIIAALRTCFDPEIPVNIYELGLIYEIDVDPNGEIRIQMTLTSPACPAAGSLPPEVRAKTKAVPGVKNAQVDVVWDPPWTPDRMSEAAKLQLGLF
jgi:FeS assembly SUF system protein